MGRDEDNEARWQERLEQDRMMRAELAGDKPMDDNKIPEINITEYSGLCAEIQAKQDEIRLLTNKKIAMENAVLKPMLEGDVKVIGNYEFKVKSGPRRLYPEPNWEERVDKVISDNGLGDDELVVIEKMIEEIPAKRKPAGLGVIEKSIDKWPSLVKVKAQLLAAFGLTSGGRIESVAPIQKSKGEVHGGE